MKRRWIKQVGLAVIAILACGTATAQYLQAISNETALPSDATPAASHVTFGSNLFRDPCGTCNYSEAGGYFVVGPDNCILPGTTQWLGVPFIAAATGVPERILAPIILSDPANCPTNKVTLGIYTDTCEPNGPGRRLVSGIATAPEGLCGLAVARLLESITLQHGEKYWVVAETNAQQAALDANWYGSNNAQYAINSGEGWEQFPGATPAFKVQGAGTDFSGPALDAAHGGFGGNLATDPCTGCEYDSSAPGFEVRGPKNCTSSDTIHWLAVPFIARTSGVPKRISASIILRDPSSCPENKVTLSLYTDNCGLGPGTMLVSGIATVPAAPCDLAVARLHDAPALQRKVKYWVVSSTNAQQAGLDANWYASNVAQNALSPGFGWIQFNDGTPGFTVE